MNNINKSVIVIDTPESCRNCPLHSFDSFSLYCKAVKDDWGWCSPSRKICDNHEKCVKPYWCPLSPLPEYRPINEDIRRGDTKSMTHLITSIHDIGYNECLDEILKGNKND